LLEAAEQLIYAGGIHATGVDAIVRRSGTARKSFYTHFASKEELVATALLRRDERWMQWFERGTLASSDLPAGQLLGMFGVLHEWFTSDEFHGCAFLNAAGEVKQADDSIFGVARLHKARLLAFIDGRCRMLGREDAGALARQLLILVDGAIEVALVSGEANAAYDARSVAQVLLEASHRRAAAG
jgi:AcrR family transcriptional regulator